MPAKNPDARPRNQGSCQGIRDRAAEAHLWDKLFGQAHPSGASGGRVRGSTFPAGPVLCYSPGPT